MLIYGSPAALVALLDDLADGARMPALPDGSAVITGGGWKAAPRPGASGDDAAIWLLLDRAAQALGVPRGRCIDTYSTAHLNTILLSCDGQRHHIPPVVDAFVVDETLRPVGAGSRGRLAIGDPFVGSHPPLIATGDVVTLADDSCPCGLPGTTVVGGFSRAPGQVQRGCGTADVAVAG